MKQKGHLCYRDTFLLLSYLSRISKDSSRFFDILWGSESLMFWWTTWSWTMTSWTWTFNNYSNPVRIQTRLKLSRNSLPRSYHVSKLLGGFLRWMVTSRLAVVETYFIIIKKRRKRKRKRRESRRRGKQSLSSFAVWQATNEFLGRCHSMNEPTKRSLIFLLILIFFHSAVFPFVPFPITDADCNERLLNQSTCPYSSTILEIHRSWVALIISTVLHIRLETKSSRIS